LGALFTLFHRYDKLSIISQTLSYMTKEQLAWLAGFIDGEGYLGLTYQVKAASLSSATTPRYHPYLIVTNTNQRVIERVHTLLGIGKVYKISRKDEKSKDVYQFKLTKAADLVLVLEQLQPCLWVKREQCELLLSYLRYRITITPLTGRGRRGVTSYGEKDRDYYQRLLVLNKKGPPPL